MNNNFLLKNTELANFLGIAAAIIAALVYLVFIYSRFRRSKTFQRRPSDILARLLPALLATFAGMISIVFFFLNKPATRLDTFRYSSEEYAARVKQLEVEIDKMIAAQREQIQKTETLKGSELGAAIAQLDQRITKNTDSIAKFEQLVMTDASRLVTVPIMQRDLQSLKDDITSVKTDVNGLRTLLAETGTQNRWVIGTLALGMLALVIPAVKSLLTPTAAQPSA
jgi:hypothetical protein